MYVPETSDLYVDKDGQRYYFCSKGCMEKFLSPEGESRSLKRRLVIAWLFSIPVLILSYALFPQKDWVLFILSIPVVFYSGFPFYRGAYSAIRNFSGNMDLLISIGVLTAFFFSLFVSIFPQAIPNSSVYFDSSDFIVSLILTGSYIENISKKRASSAGDKLLQMMPKIVHIVSGASIKDAEASSLKAGVTLQVRPGEIIAVDGTILEGRSEVDESSITGEQEPVLKTAGDRVISGTKNLNGMLIVKAEAVGADTTVSKIHGLIVMASSGRTKVQRIADIFSSYFVPVVLVAATASFLFWYFYLKSIGNPLAPEIGILAFVSVVVIACPCAIGLAGPITLLISAEESFKHGILVKNTGVFDRIRKINRIVFDKSGTLTSPLPEIYDLTGDIKALAYAASVESGSNHPVALSIVNKARDLGLRIEKAYQVVEEPGIGITGKVDGKEVRIAQDESGATIVEIDGDVACRFRLRYKLRDDAIETVSALKKMEIKVSVLSGDTSKEAKSVLEPLKLDEVITGSNPEEKAEVVRRYQEKGEYVMFVGDGINDTVALETADAGIAMGSGSDITKAAGDIVLVNNKLSTIIDILTISRSTIKKVKENIFWAIIYNSALIPIAGGVLVPVFSTSVYSVLPILAALAMGMSSTTVVLNSLRLKKSIRKSIQSEKMYEYTKNQGETFVS
ncbi:cation transporting ATPase [Thermoplasma volcanium GSS1]|uniref:Cation transporting ATPase n=2 Tax=Thermoplasma volcanium TaxID=50339 RepID=Q978Z8_THEVO|nr:cation transporting ATPase [Thermoplasma volcanium GSS1]